MTDDSIDQFARICFDNGALFMQVKVARFFKEMGRFDLCNIILEMPLPAFPVEEEKKDATEPQPTIE